MTFISSIVLIIIAVLTVARATNKFKTFLVSVRGMASTTISGLTREPHRIVTIINIRKVVRELRASSDCRSLVPALVVESGRKAMFLGRLRSPTTLLVLARVVFRSVFLVRLFVSKKIRW